MSYGKPEGFANPLRRTFHDRAPAIPAQTEEEMQAYCRAWGIPVTGKALHRPEYRTVPHPDCAYRHLPIRAQTIRTLRGQMRCA